MKELMAEFAGAVERQSKSNLLLAVSLAFALVSVTSAEAETSISEKKARVSGLHFRRLPATGHAEVRCHVARVDGNQQRHLSRF
jgi:hypothetical protein